MSTTPQFDLTERPWLPVQRRDGTHDVLSLTQVFAHSGELRRLVGDVPTQEFALLRLLLAIAYDACGPLRDEDDWDDLRHRPDPFAGVPAYLAEHRARFDLLHPTTPFFQVAGLHTEKDEVASLNRIVADVPNSSPFFSMRRPGAERLEFAEAARWLVHVHAFDTSGIKSGMVGADGKPEPRVKGGKVYPLGVGSAGLLGGVCLEGATLRDTLLFNLVPLDEGILVPQGRRQADDRPAWRRPPTGPGAWQDEPGTVRPSGPADLYTWQSRRVLLHHDGEAATGVVLGYGDPLTLVVPQQQEPLTAWRRSPNQEKKLGRSPVYLAQQHDPNRSAWRGLAALVEDAPTRALREERERQRAEARAAKAKAKAGPVSKAAASRAAAGGPPDKIRPGVLSWLAHVAELDKRTGRPRVRTRLVGARYGTQQSVIDEVVDDSLELPVALLHKDNVAYRAVALEAVDLADQAVRALGQLAGNIARASGSPVEPDRDAAQDRGYGALDEPYRRWLAQLQPPVSSQEHLARWREELRRTVSSLGRERLIAAGPAAAVGREVELPGMGSLWLDDSLSHLLFQRRLRNLLGAPPEAAPPGPDTSPDTSPGPGPAEPTAPSVPDPEPVR